MQLLKKKSNDDKVIIVYFLLYDIDYFLFGVNQTYLFM